MNDRIVNMWPLIDRMEKKSGKIYMEANCKNRKEESEAIFALDKRERLFQI